MPIPLNYKPKTLSSHTPRFIGHISHNPNSTYVWKRALLQLSTALLPISVTPFFRSSNIPVLYTQVISSLWATLSNEAVMLLVGSMKSSKAKFMKLRQMMAIGFLDIRAWLSDGKWKLFGCWWLYWLPTIQKIVALGLFMKDGLNLRFFDLVFKF